MTGAALDASALLGEPVSERAAECLDDARLCAVNLAEVVSYYGRLGADRAGIEAMIRPVPIQVVAVDAALCFDAGMLPLITLPGGLSTAACRT